MNMKYALSVVVFAVVLASFLGVLSVGVKAVDGTHIPPYIEAKWELKDQMNYDTCVGVPEENACNVYDESQCVEMAEYGCHWDDDADICIGTPDNCENIPDVFEKYPKYKCEETPGCTWVDTQINSDPKNENDLFVTKCVSVCDLLPFYETFGGLVEAVVLKPPHEGAQQCLKECESYCEENEPSDVPDCVDSCLENGVEEEIEPCGVYDKEYLWQVNPENPESPGYRCYESAKIYDPEFFKKDNCKLYWGSFNFDVEDSEGYYTVFVKAYNVYNDDDYVYYDFKENKLWFGPDSDYDGIPDSVDNCPDVYNPSQVDLNENNVGDVCESNDPQDGISVFLKKIWGLIFGNLLNNDADNDGLSDSQELSAGTDPNNPDTDGDGLLDGYDPNPLDPDSNNDGIPDGNENTIPIPM